MKNETDGTRREFLRALAAGACGACALGLAGGGARGQDDAPQPQVAVHDAMWFERLPDKAVRCTLCPRECVVADVERGYCGVRENRGGDYKTLVYGNLCSTNVDPIEKKPLFHYLPGTVALSVATAGCNMECKFCQNWEISQFRPEQVPSVLVPPENLVRAAQARGIQTIAYTYSEPVVFYEYMHDTAAAGRAAGVGSVMISNGYINEPAIRKLCEHLTAVKVDLKAFTEKFYEDACAGRLAPVLGTLEVLADIGIHTEVVVLLVPTLNDSAAEVGRMTKWLVKALGPDVPVHFSRFHPTYRMKNLPPTPMETLERARKVALDAGLHYVYLGNVPFHEAESTYCPSCAKTVIGRVGYRVEATGLKDGACASCGMKIPGVWSQEQAMAFKPQAKPAGS
ncbi:MAG: AmmeMemoRadiSam system radical SAM enzyme [Phycisphaerae bacterium]|nr:AmmeMemoRadiSam system radical SAM enzyme [Phycisphaerae bacterium]